MVVGKDRVDPHQVGNIAEDLKWIPGDAYEPSLSCLLNFAKRGYRFLHDLVEITVFNVMRLDDIDILDAEPRKTFVDTCSDALSGEVKLCIAVPSTFRR